MSSTIIVCEYELRYVSLEDTIDHENHRKIYDAAKCVLAEITEWCEAAKELAEWAN